MIKDHKFNEGYLALTRGRVWYRTIGNKDNPPLLVLHGGPGYPSDYLWNLEQLADEYFVVFYDQLGCGRSDRPKNLNYRNIEYFVQELKEVIAFLNLNKINLLGHSWGTMLALDFLLTDSTNIKTVIFASPCISIPLWNKATSKYLDELPNRQGEIIRSYEKKHNIQAPEYKIAKHLYHITHENRLDPEPANVKASASGFGSEVYNYMWGPNEYTVSGTLATYDKSNRLKEIKLPTLFTCGKYDAAEPEAVRYYHSQVLGSELAVFYNSSHMAHLEEEANFIALVRNFLNKNK